MRAAVIGAGHIARQHLACLQTLPDVQTVAVCDLSPSLAESAAERFGVARWYTDHRRMLDDARPDVVHIGTPPATHYPLAVDSLEAGAHIIVEKPVTVRYEDLRKLIEEAGRRDRMLLEDHNYLFNGSIQRVLGWVGSGELGDVIHVDVVFCQDLLGEGNRLTDPNAPHPSLSLPGGAIAEFLTHLAYLSYAFVGEHRSVRTKWDKRSSNSLLPSDELRALIVAERGTAMLMFSAHAQPDAFFVRVYGTRMCVEAHLFEPRVVCQRLRGGPRPLMPVLNGLQQARDELRYAFGSLWRKLGGPGVYEGQWELLRRAYRAMADGASPPIPIEQIDAVNRLVAELTADRNRQGPARPGSTGDELLDRAK
jgi:predicted dehydrogenase